MTINPLDRAIKNIGAILAAFGELIDPMLAKLEEQAMANALSRDYSFLDLDEHLATAPKYQTQEPPLSDDELVAVRQLIEERHIERYKRTVPVYREHFSGLCEQVNPRGYGYVCSQPLGHDGDHIAEVLDFQVDRWAADPDSARAEGTRRAHTAGEVSADTPDAAPSPAGQRSTSELLNEAADRIGATSPFHAYAYHAFIAELRDRAAQFEAAEAEPEFSIGHEELAARITESRRASHRSGYSGTATDEHLASDLLADYHISRKK
ncbi:hypothetical protein PBI_SQUIRTY_49 [Mycobacterium phage Squirty]|uniref:Uncharacterized protein n=1 Tax=Mycobacterium phage Squirty TaxID=1527512 RepID=A0A088FBJ4_9CAUD|nr:hypothetical protein PBI_SQUIRTY_49 [Mycobacterium phage Squirty]AIM40996.1 hypothetical protein PBI_SQUIRTY_49 [Mycobacterium phage Squirty]